MKFQLTQEMLDTIDQYIKGNLDGEKLKVLERELETNSALKEEMLIQKRLFQAIENQNIVAEKAMDIDKKISDPEYQELSNKIRNIGANYMQDAQMEQKPLWIRFKKFIPGAAAVFLLVIISTVYLTSLNPSLDQYYYDNVQWESELPSFSEKGDSKSEFTLGEAAFKAKKYAEAVRLFRTINYKDQLYPYSLMYIGAAHANCNQNLLALENFEQLSRQKDFAESSKGLWYMALIYLKVKDKARAIRVLELISQDPSNYRYKEAMGILKELDG